MRARFFDPADAAAWDAFCRDAHNATFLHTRAFLSYHGDRFADRSVIIERAGRWLGVIPAARHPAEPDVVVSHPGATYGGVVHHGRLRGAGMIAALETAAALWDIAGFRQLRYKALPHIYQSAPAQEDLYALFRLGATQGRADLSSCIDLAHRLPVSERRRRAHRKAAHAGLRLACGRDQLPALWPMLADNLARRHGTSPVHTLAEIMLLADRFPQHIQVLVAFDGNDDRAIAGTVLFATPTVLHAQYIAASEAGYAVNALDLVLEAAICQARRCGKRYFDFGISTEDDGRRLNDGLARFKHEFGAGGVVHQFWDLPLRRQQAAHAA